MCVVNIYTIEKYTGYFGCRTQILWLSQPIFGSLDFKGLAGCVKSLQDFLKDYLGKLQSF